MDGQSNNTEQLEALLEASLDPVIGMDADGKVIAWNAQAEETFGWTASEALQQPLSDLIIPEQHRQAHAEGLRNYLDTGQANVLNKRIEISAIDKVGREFPIELTVILVSLRLQPAFFAFLRDIGPRIAIEEDLKRRAAASELLYEASLLVSEGGSENDLFSFSIKSICKKTGWHIGHVYLFNKTTQQMEPTELWYPADNAFIDIFRTYSFKKGQGLPGRVWQSREPTYITDIETSVFFERRDVMVRGGIRSAFAFPVFYERKVYAVLEFFSTARREPNQQQINLVRSLGLQFDRVIERQQAAEVQRLYTRELHHRTNNLMAITASIFRQSMVHAESLEQLGGAFGSRLQSLSHATRLLSDGDWQSAPVAALVEVCLEPFRSRNNVEIAGPLVNLPGHRVMMLSLVIHELATNAAKHGSIGTPTGKVLVTWDMIAKSNACGTFVFSWRESGGPGVRSPSKEGFGSALLNNLLAREKGSRVDVDYHPDGLRVRMEFSLTT